MPNVKTYVVKMKMVSVNGVGRSLMEIWIGV